MNPYILSLQDEQAILQRVGGKGASLARLARAGLPVPEGFHITTAAYDAFVAENGLQPPITSALQAVDPDRPSSLQAASRTIGELFLQGHIPPQVAQAIAHAYADLSGTAPVVAVRSSATAEDLGEASFAGQQETYLNIKGIDQVLDAVKRCWASLWTARAIGYRVRHGVGTNGLSLAVVVQRLVPAEAAGILFTANPVNGRRDEAVINAAWGLGEAVVGGEVTPDTYTVNKETGEMLGREIAEKDVMTVRVNGGTATRPVPEDLRRAPVLDDAQAAELVRLGVEIEALYGDPRDIEWAMADGAFAVVQARPITALPAPAVEPPTEWPLPNPKGQYMRGSIIDMMPDPLTPLFASLGVPAINEAMQSMLVEMLGGRKPEFLDHYVLTINDYAYMTLDYGPGDWWWMMTKLLPAMPRLLKQSVRHWKQVAHPRYVEGVAEWEARSPAAMSASELVDGVHALVQAMTRYLVALQVDSLGVAAGSEMLFTRAYQKLIQREGDPSAPTYLLGSDSLPIQAEKALYDLAQWCSEHEDLAAYLQRTPTARLAGEWDRDQAPPEVEGDVWRAWQERFQAYLDRYGYSIYDLDFAKPIPAHDPTPPLQALQAYIRGQGRDPHERQQGLVERRERAVTAVRERTKGLKRKIFEKTLGWAQTYARLREDTVFEIGLGYPALREMLLELGRRLVAAGAIAQAEDIFWLEGDELEGSARSLDRGEKVVDLAERVEERRMRWQAEKQVTPPGQLPRRERIMGFKTDVFMPVDAEEQTEKVLKGIGASPGRVTAAARVLHGPEDFDQMEPGAVLVADTTTPAWTPLFALAAGIVTNVGGPLSHGSIVAREYGIPAVMGTGVATKRIENGQQVTVDGDAGTVTLS